MYSELKDEIKNIIEIVQQCPESLQEKCFELLLKYYVTEVQGAERGEQISQQNNIDNKDNKIERDENKENDLAEEIKLTDFHIKVQKFLTSNGLDISYINNIYYKENDKLLPLYETLGTTKMSECQIRIALLTAFENSFNDANGDMCFNGEVVRQRCHAMKCYDSSNFSSNFKKNSSLLDNFSDKYDKNTIYILSPDGKKELAKILLEIAKDF